MRKKLYHDDHIRGGHCGQKRMYARLRAKYFWKNMVHDIANYIRKCEKCILNKPKTATREPMKITATPQKPFDVVEVDTIGPFQKSFARHEYAVTLICDLTKYLVVVPVPNKEANTIAKAIFEDFILIYGTPKTILTDCGTEYRNEIIRELGNLMNTQHNFSTPYHHQTLGGIERSHRSLNEYLRAYSSNFDWDAQLRYFSYCYNTSFHTSLNHSYTPFELVFGRRANEIEFLKNSIEPVYNMDKYTNILKNTLQIAHKKAIEFIEKMKLKNKLYYDKYTNPIDLKVDEMILVKKEPYNKFSNVYAGPYRVKKIENENVVFEINGKQHTIHKNRTVKVKM